MRKILKSKGKKAEIKNEKSIKSIAKIEDRKSVPSHLGKLADTATY